MVGSRSPFLPAVLGLVVPMTFVRASEEDDMTKALLELLNTPIAVASSKGDNLFTAPSTVSFMDRDFLMRYGVQTLAEAVDLAAGMSVSRGPLRIDQPTSRGVLQDTYANRVLLLINGVSTWNALSGDMTLARIPIQDVERIEILKGPASVLYGSNA